MKVDHRGHKLDVRWRRRHRDANLWGDRSESKMVDITCEITLDHPEDDAIYVNDGTRSVWLPRSKITINDNGTITMPRWLAVDRKLR